ncbi:MAG TPA: hypothetical protein VGG28_13705 [Kofleriaceae bacterium]|jgi:hypothetical protein
MTHSFCFAAAVAAVLAACSPASTKSSDDDGADAGTSAPHMATFTPAWTLQNIDGSPASCKSGYDTMTISANPWDANLGQADPGGTPIVAMFDCAAGSGAMQLQIDGMLGTAMLNGKYDITWQETDSTGATIVATDVQSALDYATTVDLSGGNATATVTMYQDGGYAWIGWLLFGTMSGQYLDSCEGAGVDMIGLDLTDETSQAVTHLMFPCDTSDGIASGVTGQPAITSLSEVGSGIAAVLAGSFSIVATAYSGGQTVGASDGDDDTTIAAPNGVNIIPELPSINLTNR